jgi:trans-L-3-hydroxyproline dehydratase
VVQLYRTIDAHTAGQPLRLIVEGMPRLPGATLLEKREWARKHADMVRRAVVLEPRGHADLVAAVLTEPVSAGAHAGLLFMDAGGYPLMSGHGVISAATIAVERELFFSRESTGDEIRLVFDTPAGTVPARVRLTDGGALKRADSVAFTNVPSFVYAAACPVRLGQRELRVDVAFGGAFYAIVDTEAVGIPLRSERVADLRRLAADIQTALNAAVHIDHPVQPSMSGIAGVVFTGPAEDPEAHLRSVTITSTAVDRSPSGTGTAAVMAVLDAMGLLPGDQGFVHESLTGALFRGRAVNRTMVGERPALLPEIEGTAWITGEHRFLVDEDDPFRDGFAF